MSQLCMLALVSKLEIPLAEETVLANSFMICCPFFLQLESSFWSMDPLEARCTISTGSLAGENKKQNVQVGRSNQSILKEISSEYSLEGLMLMLKLQYFGHLMRKTDSLEKTLMLGKIDGGRRRG